MSKIKNLDDLRKLRDELKLKNKVRENSEDPENHVQIKVAMATCAIASGARDTMNFIVDELEKRNINAVVTQTGCMGYCYAEPTIEVTIPGKEPVVFGNVDQQRADLIIEKYIKNGDLVDGIIPVNYQNVENK